MNNFVNSWLIQRFGRLDDRFWHWYAFSSFRSPNISDIYTLKTFTFTSQLDWMNFGHVSIIVVNYSDIADGEYFFTSSQLGVSYVGDAVTRLLQLIMVECGVNLPVEQQSFLANISIAGHSLGAHIAGYVGFNMNRIYGYLIGIIYGN